MLFNLWRLKMKNKITEIAKYIDKTSQKNFKDFHKNLEIQKVKEELEKQTNKIPKYTYTAGNMNVYLG
jgi:hypothetical protein